MTIGDELPRLPARDPTGHKGTFGTVSVFGGRCDADAHMLGGPSLSALAALRAGCGLARLAMPTPMLDTALAIATEATGVPVAVDGAGAIVGHEAASVIDRLVRESHCLAIGPGLGTSEGARAATMRAIGQDETPVVVDADALNVLSLTPQLQQDFHASAVLTPHPGEFRRLAVGLGIESDPSDDSSRVASAEALAQRLACIAVLKGSHTVVSDGHRSWVDTTTDPVMATAGSGDVLTGVLASMIAQVRAGHASVAIDLFDCARLAVVAHSRAASIWAASAGATGGMLARDLLDSLPKAIESLRGVAATGRG
jgi:NAD(P)H-hydrate epimerase